MAIEKVSYWKGRKRGAFSDEHKKKISEAKKGQPTWNKGLKTGRSLKKGKTYEEMYGIERAKQLKDMSSKSHKGNKGYWIDKKRDEETKDKISKSKKQSIKTPRKENHWNWNNGSSRGYKTGYYSTRYKEWRKAVFERDNYICQKCGVSGRKVYLTAHHIKSFAHYPELRFNLTNGKTLCEPCHSLTDNYKGRANSFLRKG